jgi:hypothetical protein
MACRLLGLAGIVFALAPVTAQGTWPGPAGCWLALATMLGAGLLALCDRRRARRGCPAATLLTVDAAGRALLHLPSQAPCAIGLAAFHRQATGAWLALAPTPEPGGPLSGCASARDDRSAARLAAWLVWLRRARGR